MICYIHACACIGKVRVCTESWILKKFLKCAQKFSRPVKSLENRDEVLKNSKKSWVFFFEGYNRCCISEIFFCFVKSYSILPVRLQRIMKKALFLHIFFKVSTDHLQVFDNCESGKWNDCFGKSLGKVLNFLSKNLYKPWKYKSPKKFKSISKSPV